MLAITGGKGGSGKTTTTLGLAAALDRPVIVADADRDMPNLHALAGVDREPTLATLAGDAGSADPTAAAQSLPASPEVSVLPAPPLTEDASLEVLLTRLTATDGTVLVDCPAGAGPEAAVPLRVADAALLVSPLCAPALRDAAKTATMARAVGTRVVGAVLTRTSLAPDGAADLLGCPILASVPFAEPPVLRNRRVRSAYGRAADALCGTAAPKTPPG